MHGWGRLLVALIIGIATAWWIWGRRSAEKHAEKATEHDPVTPPAEAEPKRDPEPELSAGRATQKRWCRGCHWRSCE